MTKQQKKVLILMEGIGLGGTSTSLLNLLQAMRSYPQIDITVGLINMDCRDRLPEGTKVLDLSCFSRRYASRWDAVKRILCTAPLAWLQIKLILRTERKKKISVPRRVSLVQRYELRQARRAGKPLDLRREFDVVISWCEMFTNYLLADRILAEHKVAWIHPNYVQAGFAKKYDADMVAKVDRVVAVSRAGCRALAESFPEHAAKCRCIYNKLIEEDVSRKSLEQTVTLDHDVMNLITVARIQNVSKAYERTLRAMKRLKDEGLTFRWLIVGDGENRESVRELIREYGLEKEVEMLGAKSNPFPYVAAADVFLLCSYYEGFPMVVDEALALGVPVLVTDYGAAREQVEDGRNGRIVANTEEGVYGGLAELLRNPACLSDYREFLKERDTSSYASCDDFVSMIEEICEE